MPVVLIASLSMISCHMFSTCGFSDGVRVGKHVILKLSMEFVVYLIINPRRMREGYGTWFVVHSFVLSIELQTIAHF